MVSCGNFGPCKVYLIQLVLVVGHVSLRSSEAAEGAKAKQLWAQWSQSHLYTEAMRIKQRYTEGAEVGWSQKKKEELMEELSH